MWESPTKAYHSRNMKNKSLKVRIVQMVLCLLPESFNEYHQFIPFVYISCTAKDTTQEKGNKIMQFYARLCVSIYHTVYADHINNAVSTLFTYLMYNV